VTRESFDKLQTQRNQLVALVQTASKDEGVLLKQIEALKLSAAQAQAAIGPLTAENNLLKAEIANLNATITQYTTTFGSLQGQYG
jgi:peptidoglycan hydrolase CwlO-like protein